MGKFKYLKKYRNIILTVIDIIVVFIAYFSTYIFKEISILSMEVESLKTTILTIVLYIIVLKSIFILFNLNRNIVRYESSIDYVKYALAIGITDSCLSLMQNVFDINIHGIRTNTLASFFVLSGIVGYRIVLRFILNKEIRLVYSKIDNRKKILIIGAGQAGKDVLNTLEKSLSNEYKVIGFIDDNNFKKLYKISGNKILGGRDDIISICNKFDVDEIFFAIANIAEEEKKIILNICGQTKIKVKVLPATTEMIHGKGLFNSLRDVEIEDLLGRDIVKLDNSKIESLIENEVVLVTGGGGSIGSELCRQIIMYNPKTLVMVDIYENNLYEIETELVRQHDRTKIKAIVASIRDKERLKQIFEEYKPSIVFHAAAHKHVPLMESSPLEAIKNNIFGTWNVINISDEFKVKRFIQISTDKAVNPTNIMGATKRMCEMMIQAKNKVSNTEYVAVRFGNVLGSNGSVIPLFKKQIKAGGPVTLTHKDITRYFMTIPEAVSLVIQAMTFASGGEIFVLDMGEPVKIYDLAKTLIKLSGYELGKDMEIEITGLRPGEKLYEELLMDSKGLEKTTHEKIFVEEDSNITVKDINSKLDRLNSLINNKEKDINKIKKVMKKVVPTYKEVGDKK